MFKLTIETDNAAFEGDALPHEIARILRDAANQVQGCRMSGRLFDANGNRVGDYDTEAAAAPPTTPREVAELFGYTVESIGNRWRYFQPSGAPDGEHFSTEARAWRAAASDAFLDYEFPAGALDMLRAYDESAR